MRVVIGDRELVIGFFTERAPKGTLFKAVLATPSGYAPAEDVLPFRAWTRCTVKDGHGATLALGFSRCSRLDTVCPGDGNKAALARALAKCSLVKAERAAVWAAFFEVALRSGWFADHPVRLAPDEADGRHRDAPEVVAVPAAPEAAV